MPHVEIATDITKSPVIRLWSTYSDRERIKRIPGSRWVARINDWTLPLGMASCYALRTEFPGEDQLSIGPELTRWATEEGAWRARAMVMRQDPTGAGTFTEEEGGLKCYQQLAVEFLLNAKGALLADDQGVGKSASAVAAIEKGGLYPALVVCPKSVIPTWVKEFEKWSTAPPRVVVATGGAAKQRKAFAAAEAGEADVVVTNYEALKNHTRCVSYGSNALTDKERAEKEANAVPWKCVVADEAHRLRDPRTQLTRAVKGVSRDVEYRFALTGTPMESTPDELWSIYNFIAPEDFPAKTKFIDRYLSVSPNPWGGITVNGLDPWTEAEYRKMTDPRTLRRTKALVLPHLPPKVRSTRYGKLSPKERKAYAEMRDESLARLSDGSDLMALDPMVLFGRLLQMASSSLVTRPDGTLEPVDPSSKLDLLMDTLEDVGGEPVIVWFKHRGLLHLFEKRLHKAQRPYTVIHGDVSVEERQRAENLFQGGRSDLMLLTIGAGAEGLTLTRAGTAIYVQRDFSSLKMSQSEDRIHRHGSEVHEQINLIDLVMEDTVEEKLPAMLADKKDRIEEVLRDFDLIKELLS